MIKLIKNLSITFSITISYLLAAENSELPEGKITSPYEACKNILIVSPEKYQENKLRWDQTEDKCNAKVQLGDNFGVKKIFTQIDPLKEGLQYKIFAKKVAEKVVANLKKNREYAECSARCFSGVVTSCPGTVKEEAVKCIERKKEIEDGMKVLSRKIRMELALSNDAPGLLDVNIRNVLNVDKDKFINTSLRDFEVGTPNPVGRIDLSERELTEAKRRSELDRQALESEFEKKGYKNYSEWMSVKLMQNFEEHRARYRELIYEKAPIFAVIDRPIKMEKGEDPVWSDTQLTQAFSKLSENIKMTEEKVNESLNNSTLEFKRVNGEALKNFIISKKDLLYYIGMKNQVEEVLKDDPSSCGIATSMEARLHTKEIQNAGITFASTAALSMIGGPLLTIGGSLTLAEAGGVIGMVLGNGFLIDSFRQFNKTTTEAVTLSGLGGDRESTSLRKGEEVKKARDSIKTALAFAVPLNAFGVSTLSNIPKGAKLSDGQRILWAEKELTKAGQLKAPLTKVQKQAIIDAHNVGKGKLGKDGSTPAGPQNWTNEQIKEKRQIILASGLRLPQWAVLRKTGVTGYGDHPAASTTLAVSAQVQSREGGTPAPWVPSREERLLYYPNYESRDVMKKTYLDWFRKRWGRDPLPGEYSGD